MSRRFNRCRAHFCVLRCVALFIPLPALAAWTYPLTDWMSGMRDDVPLANLTMPASHDAGANEANTTGVGLTDTFGLEELSVAQDLTLRGQMDAGVRFFDLRPCLVDGTLRTCHIAHDDVWIFGEVGGCYGESLRSAFDAAANFLGGHPGETLIFKISHWDYPVGGSSGDRANAQNQFFSNFVYGYDSILLKWDTARDGALPRLNALPLKKARGKLIVVCDGVSGWISPAKGTWGYSDGNASAGYLGVYDDYSNTDDCDDMMNDQINKWASQNQVANADRAFLLSWTLTMQTDWKSVLKGVVSGSIEDFADEANPRLASALSARIAAGYKRPTFVLLDYVSATWSSVIVAYNEPNERRPAAKVSVGSVTVGRDFAVATVPVRAQVAEYGSARSAKVVVTLTPVGGGSKVTREFAIGGDTAEHQFSAAFDGLTAGARYDVTAKVMFGDASGGNDDGRFFAADEFTWFDERATSFSAANWTGAGETVVVQDGALVIRTGEDAETAFMPERKSVSSAQIVLRIRDCGACEEGALSDVDGLAAVSAIVRSNNRSELVVLGGGKWNATGIFFSNIDANIDVVIDFDLRNHSVKYSVDGKAVGTYSLPNTVSTVSSIVFQGYVVLSELAGTAANANLVRGADGTEYATFADAVNAGATGVLTPLWLSTWTLTGFSGMFDVYDPNKLVTCVKGSQTVKTESLGGNVTRFWHARLSDADIRAGAEKYLKAMVKLDLVKAITDESTARIGDYLVANGEMSFTVEVDDARVAKEAVRDFVEVKGLLSDTWDKPSVADIDFKDGKVVVTPNRGGASGFVRVRIRPDGEDVK